VAVPSPLLGYSRADVNNQRTGWRPTPFWRQALAGNGALFDALVDEVAAHGGIRRVFVHGRATGDPVELFLAAMAWGFGSGPVRYPRQRAMLVGPTAAAAAAAANITHIVSQTQTVGAGAGWSALLTSHKVDGLEMSFGTKLLYFAGYSINSPGPRPLILDKRVRAALVALQPGVVPPPPKKVFSHHYLAYLELAAQWATDPRWNQSPDVVEYALFQEA
jgi:hypothetical protein